MHTKTETAEKSRAEALLNEVLKLLGETVGQTVMDEPSGQDAIKVLAQIASLEPQFKTQDLISQALVLRERLNRTYHEPRTCKR